MKGRNMGCSKFPYGQCFIGRAWNEFQQNKLHFSMLFFAIEKKPNRTRLVKLDFILGSTHLMVNHYISVCVDVSDEELVSRYIPVNKEYVHALAEKYFEKKVFVKRVELYYEIAGYLCDRTKFPNKPIYHESVIQIVRLHNDLNSMATKASQYSKPLDKFQQFLLSSSYKMYKPQEEICIPNLYWPVPAQR